MSEVDQMLIYAAQHDNLQFAVEVRDRERFFGKTVKIVKGRKLPIGLTGIVTHLVRRHYGASPWFGFDTRIGILIEDGQTVFTSAKNVVVQEVAP